MSPVYMSTHHSSAGHHSLSGQHVPVIATRSERVAQRSGVLGFFGSVAAFLKRDQRGKFIVLMFLTSIALSCVVGAWNEPFHFRISEVTERAIVSKTAFSVFSPDQTDAEIQNARSTAPHVFVNDPQQLIQLRESLWNTLTVLSRVNTYDELEEQDKLRWLQFLRQDGRGETPENLDVEAAFANFIVHFKNEFIISEDDSESLQTKLLNIFMPFETRGILIQLPEFGQGSRDRILVYLKQNPSDETVEYRVSEVLLRDGTIWKIALRLEIKSSLLCDLLFNWISPQIPETLREDQVTTIAVANEAAEKVKRVFVEYAQGQLLVSAGKPLQRHDIKLLHAEYKELLRTQTTTQQFVRFVSTSSVYFLALTIIISLAFRAERRRPQTPTAFFCLMLGIIVTVAIAQCSHSSAFTSADWEILPLMLFVMFVSIVYSWKLATILSIFLTTVIVCGSGASLDLFIILLGTSVATAVQLDRLRSREKLVVVSIISGFAAFFLTITQGLQVEYLFDKQFYVVATINFLWAILAGLLMTGMLPFLEKQLDILTDMSLLELGDVSHPLIQQLIKAAPATYGHCTQVGVIAETAADAINARGLLTRVGAYFHDIGKIMKPEYFSENQGGINNVHDTIEPQLSTYVLIAHVKDGVDMARQYHLPKPLIDLIEQHHGTSLISFFYGRATKGGTEEVEESTYRYPGPKPQTKEAAILMIADTCESACRSMGTGVPPNKVEAKIRALVKHKLDDGQFDDCGLTLNQLKIVEKSVINSIVAAMHGRIQYPEGSAKHVHHRDNDFAQPDARSDMDTIGIYRAERMG